MRIQNKSVKRATCITGAMFIMLASGILFADSGEVNYTHPNQSLGPRGATGFITEPAQGSAVEIATQFLISQREVLFLTATDMDEVEVAQTIINSETGSSYIHFLQKYHGLEIFNARSNITVSRNGAIMSAYSNFFAGIDRTASGEVLLTEQQAIAAAAAHLGLKMETLPTVLSSKPDGDRAAVMSRGNIARSDITMHLVYQPVNGKKLRLAWNIQIEAAGSHDYFNVSVDAENGDLLYKGNFNVSENFSPYPAGSAPAAKASPLPKIVGEKRQNKVQASDKRTPDTYTVFEWPKENPGDGPRTDAADPADSTVSPYGWHDTNGVPGAEHTLTRGNNVNAYADRNDDDAVDPGSQPDAGPSLDFTGALVAYDPALEPDAYIAAAVTNLFYWNNIVHDVTALHGFDEASGNFQTFNYSGFGAGNDEVQAEAQDGADLGNRNNANFGTPEDGLKPRMQMFLWNTATPELDGDFSSMIIVHEYAHGISNRLTGGGANVNCLQNDEQMGEGWSDWIGLVLTADPSESATTPRGVGWWALGQPEDGPGIRAARYSTDFAVNNFTYDRIKTTSGPHSLGHVWASILWEVYWALVDEHGFNPNIYEDWSTGGNNLALRLVLDGMKNQPCSPGFVDGRDGILQADQDLTGGANQCIIWEAFARRGLGFSADQGSSGSRTDGTEAFDLPESCQLLEALDASIQTCAGTDAEFGISLGGGFTGPITLSASNNPTGSSVSFSINPATPNSTITMTVTTAGVLDSVTVIDVSGSDGVTTGTSQVELSVLNTTPAIPESLLPAEGATDVTLRPRFSWAEGTITEERCASMGDLESKYSSFGDSENVLSMIVCLDQILSPVHRSASPSSNATVEIATDPAFTNVIATMFVSGFSAISNVSLAQNSVYYWRVHTSNACGDGPWSDGQSFTTGTWPANILLVDDDDNSPDMLPTYEALLNASGVPYTVWDTGAGDNEPTAGDLSAYAAVLWFTGDSFAAEAGPSSASETALAAFLDNGGCLLMSSQDYHYARGLTALMTGYLGVASISNDTGSTTVTGVAGSSFDGLGPYTLAFPFSNYADTVTPGNGGMGAFESIGGITGTVKTTGIYSAFFTTVPLEAFPSISAQLEVLGAFLGTCP